MRAGSAIAKAVVTRAVTLGLAGSTTAEAAFAWLTVTEAAGRTKTTLRAGLAVTGITANRAIAETFTLGAITSKRLALTRTSKGLAFTGTGKATFTSGAITSKGLALTRTGKAAFTGRAVAEAATLTGATFCARFVELAARVLAKAFQYRTIAVVCRLAFVIVAWLAISGAFTLRAIGKSTITRRAVAKAATFTKTTFSARLAVALSLAGNRARCTFAITERGATIITSLMILGAPARLVTEVASRRTVFRAALWFQTFNHLNRQLLVEELFDATQHATITRTDQ